MAMRVIIAECTATPIRRGRSVWVGAAGCRAPVVVVAIEFQERVWTAGSRTYGDCWQKRILTIMILIYKW